MKRKMSLLPCLILLFSCGSDDGESGPGALATPGGFCVAWGERACNDEVLDVCGATEREDCIESQAEFCESLFPEEGYDPTFAKRCLDAVRAAFADADLSAEELELTRNLGGDCAGLIRGEAGEGDACQRDVDCDTTGGFECVLRGAEGTCQKPEVVGGGLSCDEPNIECEEDFFCNGKNCVERLEEEEECESDRQCDPDLRCGEALGAGGSSGAPSCIPRVELTEPCQQNRDCKSRICLSLVSSDEGVCVSRVRLSQNEPICSELR